MLSYQHAQDTDPVLDYCWPDTGLISLFPGLVGGKPTHMTQPHQHYITLHYITLHYITLHYITLHYITLHYITVITLHYITLHYITLHYITLHYITLHYITSRFPDVTYFRSRKYSIRFDLLE